MGNKLNFNVNNLIDPLEVFKARCPGECGEAVCEEKSISTQKPI